MKAIIKKIRYFFKPSKEKLWDKIFQLRGMESQIDKLKP